MVARPPQTRRPRTEGSPCGAWPLSLVKRGRSAGEWLIQPCMHGSIVSRVEIVTRAVFAFSSLQAKASGLLERLAFGGKWYESLRIRLGKTANRGASVIDESDKASRILTKRDPQRPLCENEPSAKEVVNDFRWTCFSARPCGRCCL